MKEVLHKITNKVVSKSKYIWIRTRFIGKAFKREARETEVASKILLKIVKGKKVSPEEIHFLKEQSFDIGKALAIIGVQAVPGSSLAIIAIEKVGQKYGFTLFPKAQTELKKEKENESGSANSSESQNAEKTSL